MGSRKKGASYSSSSPARTSSQDMANIGLRQRHQHELENLTLTTQPFNTLKFFILGIIQYIKRSISYLFAKGGWLMLLGAVVVAFCILLITIDGPHDKHVDELGKYFWFVSWWLVLGVASSIGLGSGLHTFVLYLGPHIAFFTIKAMQCGRVDLKTAPYDTIQLKSGPSWLEKNCSEFGPSLFPTSHGTRIPLSSILPQVQLEAILWGMGTALGELPPYFISRAARLSGCKMEELDDSPEEVQGVVSKNLNKIKHWFLSHAQHLNFFTILVLASVPNPLFDLAGIMCGQFGVPFWKFFLSTLIGKALIKTHIQTAFIISVCNNQLFYWIENEFIWLLGFIPGFASVLPSLIVKLNAVRDKYLTATPTAKLKVSKWDFSFTTIWNSIVWMMLFNFFIKIVNSTAQGYLKKQQEKELSAKLTNKSS